jgi:peptide/nickel transport system permease protein
MSLPYRELGTAPNAASALEPAEVEIGGRSLRQIAWRRLKQDKVAMAGLIGIVLIFAIAVFASQLNHLYGHEPAEFNSRLTDLDTTLPFGRFGGMSSTHWLGVQPGVSGRDLLSQLIAGTRTSLVIALSATLLSLILGVVVGIASGYYRGKVDLILVTSIDALLTFPVILLTLTLLTIFSLAPSFLGMSGQVLAFALVIFLLGFFGFAYLARVVRGQVIALRDKEFIYAARSLGASDWRIITREILPNLMGPLLVWLTLQIPVNILAEAALSYFGVGLQPETPSWGGMLATARDVFYIDPMFLVLPGTALFLTVLAFNLFGDGLRDAFDPRSTR